MFSLPEDLMYTKEHIWIRMEDGRARLGITDFLAEKLVRTIQVELPEEGAEVDPTSELGHVTGSGFGSVDLFSPLAGTVAEVNVELEADPELVAGDPYGEGWICALSDFDKEDCDLLLSPEDYETVLEEEPE